jgi:hypothetical protein
LTATKQHQKKAQKQITRENVDDEDGYDDENNDYGYEE